MGSLVAAVTAREMVYSNIELEEIIQTVCDNDLRVTKLPTLSNYVSISNDIEKEELEYLIKKSFIEYFKNIYENSDIKIRTPLECIISSLEEVDSYVLFKVNKSMSSTDDKNIQVYYIEKTSTR